MAKTAGSKRSAAANIRKRNSRACENCRKMKCGCVASTGTGGTSEKCVNCFLTNMECVYVDNARKRGPPKGYIDIIEARLFHMEAIVASILSDSDPRARALIERIRTNLAQRGGPPDALDSLLAPSQDGSPPPRYVPPYLEASPTPQEQASFALMRVVDVPGQLCLNSKKEATILGPSSGIPALASISLCFKNHFWHVRDQESFESRSPRSGNSGKNDTSYFNPTMPSFDESTLSHASIAALLPPTTLQHALFALYWEHVHPHFPVLHEPTVGSGFYLLVGSILCGEPAEARKNRLYSVGITGSSATQAPISLALLLSMYALSAPFLSDAVPVEAGTPWANGTYYFDLAVKYVSSSALSNSSLADTQALVLLAYRQIGRGILSSAWMLAGMAIRMGQDLGISRDSAPKLATGDSDGGNVPRGSGTSRPDGRPATSGRTRPSTAANSEMASDDVFFTQDQCTSRNCTWWACLILDRFLAASLGRPMHINDNDYDGIPRTSSFLGQEAQDELRHSDSSSPPIVGLHQNIPSEQNRIFTSAKDYQQHNPSRQHLSTEARQSASTVMSCYQHLTSLYGIIGHIIQGFYGIHTRASENENLVLASLLDNALCDWFDALPSELAFDVFPLEETATAVQQLPARHILTLHATFYTALILLHRPFMEAENDVTASGTRDTTQNQPQNYRVGYLGPARHVCHTSAGKISSIISAYSRVYGLALAPPILVYPVFMAATTSQMLLHDPQWSEICARNMGVCLDALRVMGSTLPSAAQMFDIVSQGLSSGYAYSSGSSSSDLNYNPNTFNDNSSGSDFSPPSARHGGNNRSHVSALPMSTALRAEQQQPVVNGRSDIPLAQTSQTTTGFHKEKQQRMYSHSETGYSMSTDHANANAMMNGSMNTGYSNHQSDQIPFQHTSQNKNDERLQIHNDRVAVRLGYVPVQAESVYDDRDKPLDNAATGDTVTPVKSHQNGVYSPINITKTNAASTLPPPPISRRVSNTKPPREYIDLSQTIKPEDQHYVPLNNNGSGYLSFNALDSSMPYGMR